MLELNIIYRRYFMPISDTGTQTCEKCKNQFEWILFELLRQNLSSNIAVETIPDGTKVHKVINLPDGSYQYYVNCPYCGFDNIFIRHKSLSCKISNAEKRKKSSLSTNMTSTDDVLEIGERTPNIRTKSLDKNNIT